MSAYTKLTDERVREILSAVSDSIKGEREVLRSSCKGVWRFGGLTCPELQSLTQEVLDLRTANGLLEATIAKMEAQS